MSLTDGTGLSAADVLALTNSNNDMFGGNGFGGWWIILFILLLGGNGFGNWGNNGANNTLPYILGNQSGSEVQRGFDQQAVITALGNLSAAVSQGFAAASVDSCNKAMATQMQMSNDKFDTITTLNNGHNAILQQMGAYEMARQNCCCENKAAIADLKYTVATENCADRTALGEDGVARNISNGCLCFVCNELRIGNACYYICVSVKYYTPLLKVLLKI